jgi:hypothetical protein
MKTKELIKALEELDPIGESYVVIEDTEGLGCILYIGEAKRIGDDFVMATSRILLTVDYGATHG